MKATRTPLLVTLLCLSAAASRAQTAPNSGGDLGLFTMPTAAGPRAGQLILGVYAWKEQLVAGDLPGLSTSDKTRLYSHWAGSFAFDLGLTDHWSVFAAPGLDRFRSRGGWRGGAINAISFPDAFVSNQASKIRIGTKYVLTSEDAPGLSFGLWLASHVPVEGATLTQNSQFSFTSQKVTSRRADWEWGAVVTKGMFSGMVSYQLSGKQEFDARVSNRLRFGLGVEVPVLPVLSIITELDRTILDGGDLPQPSYSVLSTGARIWIGSSGFALTAALNANVDMLVHHGASPSPLGGLVGVSYAAWPPAPLPPVVVPRPAPPTPAPVEEEKKEREPPVPAVAPAAPPPPTPKTTRDEIFFDGTGARLTNIAKAILDGIALRMKSDLNSTAVITGYTDNSGKEEANVAISQKRADAAREYLVTRHGIDPNRLATAAKGSAEPAYDNATKEGREKNRRAVIVVTFVSGA
ncbi:MAG TPA: OmpA family protein [Thermoanaerobaculia bacterium]|nr:OmpA family protein [Thermoanaerobaculia bacterium]